MYILSFREGVLIVRKKTLNQKIVFSSFILLFLLIICFCSNKIYTIYKERKAEKELLGQEEIGNSLVFKEAYKYMGDGWYYSISSTRHEEDNHVYVYNYSLSGCNIKYETLEDNYGMYVDSQNPENNYRIPINPPSLVTSYKSLDGIKTEREERREIEEYLNQNKWNRRIMLEDLAGITFVNFDSNDIVELWNNMYEKDYSDELGEYASLNTCALKKENKDKNYYQVGVYVRYGFIQDVKIDYVDDNGIYLTDKIEKNTATELESSLYENIKLIEKEIIAKGSFDVEDEFEDLKKSSSYESIFQLLDYFESYRGRA